MKHGNGYAQNQSKHLNVLSFGQQKKVIRIGLAISLVQTFIIFIAMRFGFAVEYIAVCLIAFNTISITFYQGAEKGQWPYIGVPSVDYSLTLMFILLLPLCLSFLALNSSLLPESFPEKIIQENLHWIPLFKSLHVLRVPQSLQPDITRHAIIIYSMGIVILTVYASLILSAISILQISKINSHLYRTSKEPDTWAMAGAFCIIGYILGYILAPHYGVTIKPVFLNGRTEMHEVLSENDLKITAYFWCGAPFLLTASIPLIIGYWRYKYIRNRSKS